MAKRVLSQMDFDGRYKGLLIPYELTEQEKSAIKTQFNCLTYHLGIKRRIGSISESGKVYESSIGGIPVVIKTNDVLDEFTNEVAINNLLNDYPDYVLQLITSEICQITNEYGEAGKLGIMVLEKAAGDLRQVLDTSELADRQLDEMMEKMFKCLDLLARMSISHGDFHCGNLFFTNRDGRNTWVIGDFGKSRDYYKEISNRFVFPSVDREFHRFLTTLLEHISKSKIQSQRYNLINGNQITRHNNFIARLIYLRNFYGRAVNKMENRFDEYIEKGYDKGKDRIHAIRESELYFIKIMQNAWIESGQLDLKHLENDYTR